MRVKYRLTFKMLSYRTVEKCANDEFTEKRSRFIGYVKPVKTEEEAIEFITQIKHENWDAKHNVYAYVLREGNIQRYSDDGEPQGTAGVPVLDVLKKEQIVDCVVVVTRYFGGILLGGGGLVRAYSHASKIAVEAGVPVEMQLCDISEICCDYSFYGRLAAFIPEQGGVIETTDFNADVCVRFYVPADKTSFFRKELINISNGRYDASVLGQKYVMKK